MATATRTKATPAPLTREILDFATTGEGDWLALPDVSDETIAELGRYFFKVGQQMRGREGMAYNATITRDGKPFVNVHDDGHGGCVWVDYAGKHLPEEGWAMRREFEAFAKSLYAGEFMDTDRLVSLIDTLSDIRTQVGKGARLPE